MSCAGVPSSNVIQPSGSRLSCDTPCPSPMTMRSAPVPGGGGSRRVAVARGTGRQTNVTPEARQIASASSSTRETSDGRTSASVTTVTIIGGDAAGCEAASAVQTASAAAARLVMISILPAIDGRDWQKFDVRNRDERTLLNLEIDRDNV